MHSIRRFLITPVAPVLVAAAAVLVPPAGAFGPLAAVAPAQSGVSSVAVGAGQNFSCAVLKGGQAKCWGDNGYGQLGVGAIDPRGDTAEELGDFLTTVDLGRRRTARSVVGGAGFACALLDNLTVKCWGQNGGGQLGQGDAVQRGDEPGELGDAIGAVNLGTGRRVRSLGVGVFHACAVLDNGALKCWGANSAGQLGNGSTTVLGDSPNELGDGLVAVDLGTGRRAKAVSGGYYHTCALLDNGSVKCWGKNDDGQLGLGNTVARGNSGAPENAMGNALPAVNLGTGRRATAIVSGYYHNCALLDNGSVKCWGWNNNGQLGVGDNITRGDSAAAGHEMGNALPAVKLGAGRKARAIYSGAFHTCAVLDNGALKCWGNNGWGQLGYGNNLQRGGPGDLMGDTLLAVDLGAGRRARSLAMGHHHTCALLDNGTVRCWGKNNFGQLGLGDIDNRGDDLAEVGSATPPVNLGVRVRSFSVLGLHACAVLENRTLQCWGDNSNGGLGLGNTINYGKTPGTVGNQLPAVDLGVGRTVTALAKGSGNHTCAILSDTSLRCWGSNGFGELGRAAPGDVGDDVGEMPGALTAVQLGTGRRARSVALGLSRTCAILDNGSVKCWGDNSVGQLGLGDLLPRGLAPGSMGDGLPAVPLGSGRRATALALGDEHTCALLDNGSVKCWGANSAGQLGLGNTVARGDSGAPGHGMGNSLPAVSLGTGRRAKAIAAGVSHTCAILDNGSVKCWGSNVAGALGLGDTRNRGDHPNEMGNDLDTVDLGTGRRARAISAGMYFTCALLDNGSVKCWGANLAGQLGLGETRNRGDDPDEMGDYLPAVAIGGSRRAIALSVGTAHACVLLDDRTIRCWGDNFYGELGAGDSANRGSDPSEMGNNLKPVVLTG